MDKELNIKLIENKDCSITVVDTTRLPLDDEGKVNRAFVEFIIKDNVVTFNLVTLVRTEADIQPTTIKSLTDGFYKYYRMAIPMLDFYKTTSTTYTVVEDGVARCFYYDKKIYKPNTELVSSTITVDDIATKCTKITSVMDMWALREDDDNIYSAYREYFSLCLLKNCFLLKTNETLEEYQKNRCSEECSRDSEAELKRDFLMASIYVLEWLIQEQEYEEAARILDLVNSCDDYLCSRDILKTKSIGGCNCGKS